MADQLSEQDVSARRNYRGSEAIDDVSLRRRSKPAGTRNESPTGPLGTSLDTALVDSVDVISR